MVPVTCLVNHDDLTAQLILMSKKAIRPTSHWIDYFVASKNERQLVNKFLLFVDEIAK